MTPDLLAAWADLRHWAAGVSLARPASLWLSLVPLLLAAAGWLAARRGRADLHRLGRPAALFALTARPRRFSRPAAVARFVGWTLLVLAAAGPRWGAGPGDGVAVGRDVVLVLDLSRSMTADDAGGPRWRAAVRGATDLLDGLRGTGGHRAAVVLFAAKPMTLVPLTTDLDHLATALAEIDGDHPPAAVRPDPAAASGTRIGAALAAAVAAHDPRFPGARDIVLFTDGDDPAADREWSSGVTAARAAGVPVHVVGIGDAARATPLTRDGRPVVFDGMPATTRLREDILTELAAEGRGEYLSAGRAPTPPAGAFFRTVMRSAATRELADNPRPNPADRSGWLFAAALACLLVSWWREP